MNKVLRNRLVAILATIAIALVGAFVINGLTSNKDQAKATGETPTLTIVAKNLAYSDSNYLLYAIGSSGFDTEENEIQMLFWAEGQTEYKKGTESYIKANEGSATVKGQPCLIFYSNGISAKNMVDNIYARAYVEVNGVGYYSDLIKYSVVEYVYEMREAGNLTTAQEDAFSALLNYGASIQVLLDYNTDRLANASFNKISVVNGTLADATTSGRYLNGEKVTLIANEPEDGARFSHWLNKNGEIVATEQNIQVYVGEVAEIYTAVFVEDGYLDAYNGTYGYEFLGTTENGAEKQSLYKAIDNNVRRFHVNTTIDADADNLYATVNYSDLGLSSDDALAVWSTYRNDNPLYYWMSNTLTYDSSAIGLYSEEEYSLGSVRASYNALVYEKVEEYVALGDGDDNAYQTALLFHDAIINNISYAYDEDGNPSDETYAHNIIGAFENQMGVCETYARTFQLLMNYSGIENIFVTGVANNDNHAWNLVKLDDGNYYWCDLTWDDRDPSGVYPSDSFRTADYNYFLVNDTEYVDWTDYEPGAHLVGSKNFLNNHTVYTVESENGYYLYDLPTRGTSIYNPENEIVIRETFTIDGISYTTNGYNEVQLVAVSEELTDVVISETIEHENTNYSVVSVGSVGDSGNYEYRKQSLDYFSYDINNCGDLTLPKTVEYVCMNFGFNIENIFIDEENPYFTSVDGVLFTKNLYTLIDYPEANVRPEYVIPDETVYVSASAFFYQLKIEKLTVGKNAVFGYLNWGDGFYDKQPTGITNRLTGEFERTIGCLSADRELVIHSENPYYEQDEFAVYDESKTTLYLVNTGVTSFTIPNTVKIIADYALMNRASLTTLEIPDSVTSIGRSAFANCSSLTTVEIPNSVTSIGYNAFYNCTSLTGIEIPDSVESIGIRAFGNCDALTSVVIGDGVKSIASEAFSGCDSITSVVIGDGLTSIGRYAFNCKSLTSIEVSENNANYKSIDGNLYSKDGKTLVKYAIGKTATSFIVSEEVEVIGECAFSGCDSLTSVEMPDSVDSIGDSAFSGCDSLTSVVLGDSVTSIGTYAFYYCRNLTNIEIPNSVTSIGSFAFYPCTSLASVEFKNTEGWKAGSTSLSSEDLSDMATAAKYLRSTYYSSTWTRS